jgi:hypothetical protein
MRKAQFRLERALKEETLLCDGAWRSIRRVMPIAP